MSDYSEAESLAIEQVFSEAYSYVIFTASKHG